MPNEISEKIAQRITKISHQHHPIRRRWMYAARRNAWEDKRYAWTRRLHTGRGRVPYWRRGCRDDASERRALTCGPRRPKRPVLLFGTRPFKVAEGILLWICSGNWMRTIKTNLCYKIIQLWHFKDCSFYVIFKFNGDNLFSVGKVIILEV